MTVIKQTLQKGPKVKVSFTLENEVVQNICLSPSDRFHFEVHYQNKNSVLVQDIIQWIFSYANKEKRRPSLPINLSGYTPFQKRVYQALEKSVISDVFSYKGLAKKIGHPNAYRAVGSCCGKNRYLLYIPCHRVVRSGKALGGFALPLKVKQELLAFEASS